jgi:UDP-galactopyranose mutase
VRGVDWLIVGAGLTGSVVAERIASQLGRRVLVIDRRGHVGGNAYDELDAAGVLVHRYGPHIFHTNSERIWTYLSRFTAWRPYQHRVVASIEGKLVPVPFNLTSLFLLLPDRARRLADLLASTYGHGARVPILDLRNSSNRHLRWLAEYIYDRVFLGYTMKQWGRRPEDLDASVTARVPVVVSHDNRYFQDRYQAMPAQGYSSLVSRILSHRKIEISLRTDYAAVADVVGDTRVVYTGPIDEYFEYRFGPLEYRTIRFEFRTESGAYLQPVATINYPNDHSFTRVTEFKHLTGQDAAVSTLVWEYPGDHMAGQTEPYYPVPRAENRQLYAQYMAAAGKLAGRVVFAGRLGDYRYYNMDQAVGRALALFERVIVPWDRGEEPGSLPHEGGP